MKKILYALLMIIVITLGSIVLAANDNIRVYDNADLFTDSEYKQLTNDCLTIGNKIKLDIIILTTDDTQNKSSMVFADDFYDSMGFGYKGPNGNGILLLINMDNREAWISTFGETIDYFTDERINIMLDDIFKYLPNSDYFNSCNSFINSVETYMWSKPYSPQPIYLIWWFQLLVAVGISGIIVGLMAYNSGGKITVTGNTYLDSGNTKQNISQDHYIKTVTTSVKKPTSSSSQSGGHGGSSTHKSSSGRTHGGGGRKF